MVFSKILVLLFVACHVLVQADVDTHRDIQNNVQERNKDEKRVGVEHLIEFNDEEQCQPDESERIEDDLEYQQLLQAQNASTRIVATSAAACAKSYSLSSTRSSSIKKSHATSQAATKNSSHGCVIHKSRSHTNDINSISFIAGACVVTYKIGAAAYDYASRYYNKEQEEIQTCSKEKEAIAEAEVIVLNDLDAEDFEKNNYSGIALFSAGPILITILGAGGSVIIPYVAPVAGIVYIGILAANLLRKKRDNGSGGGDDEDDENKKKKNKKPDDPKDPKRPGLIKESDKIIQDQKNKAIPTWNDPAAINFFENLKKNSTKQALHRQFGNLFKDKKTGLWWSKDNGFHGGPHYKVFKETVKGLEHQFNADLLGNPIVGQHKGPVGAFISWNDVRLKS